MDKERGNDRSAGRIATGGSGGAKAHVVDAPDEPAPRPMGRVVYGGHSFRKRSSSELKDVAPEAAMPPSEPIPIWFSALLATHCEVKGDGTGHLVRWNCVSGRALYTNDGTKTQHIEPLGVSLQGGQTLAVSWTPGDTSYTLEVIRPWDYLGG